MLRVAPWWDPTLALHGHDPLGDYAETYWTPVLGPAAIVNLRWANRMFVERSNGFEIRFADFARHVGLGSRRGRNSPAARCIDRLQYFGLATVRSRLLVRTHVPDLPTHLRRRLPADLRDERSQDQR